MYLYKKKLIINHSKIERTQNNSKGRKFQCVNIKFRFALSWFAYLLLFVWNISIQFSKLC